MTTLAALHKPGYGTVIGSDSQVTMGNRKTTLNGGKWITAHGWAIGVSGYLRTHNIIDSVKEEMLEDLEGPFDFSSRLLNLLKSAGYCPDNESGPPDYGAAVLLASSEGLWNIDDLGSVVAAGPGELVAGGSGSGYAFGAGYALRNLTSDPKKRVQAAIEAGAFFDPYSGGDVWMMQLKISTKRRKISKQ